MGHLHLLQPALPSYRLDLFRRLAEARPGRLTVHYSPGGLGVLTGAPAPDWAHALGPLRRIAPGLFWQSGAAGLRLARGDVLVVPSDGRTLSTHLLARRARREGVPVIGWGQWRGAGSSAWRQRLRLALARRTDGQIFYTRDELDAYRATRMGGRDPRPLAALDNGIDVAAAQRHRAPYRAGERGRVLVFLGRLTAKARLDLLLDALARPALADVRLLVLGEGEEAAALRHRAARLGLEPRVEWLGATTDERDIAAAMARARLHVYPGAVGLSLIHAMAHGVPSILHADRARHMPEIAAWREGEAGVAFAPGDPASLAAAIAGSLDDVARLERWSAHGLAQADERYNTEAMARRFLAMIDRFDPSGAAR